MPEADPKDEGQTVWVLMNGKVKPTTWSPEMFDIFEYEGNCLEECNECGAFMTEDAAEACHDETGIRCPECRK